MDLEVLQEGCRAILLYVQKKCLQKKIPVFTQYPNGEENRRKRIRKFTSAQRAQMVWRIVRRIGTGNGQGGAPSNLDRLLETGIITAAYPVHDGNIKLAEGEDPTANINDRRVSTTRKQGRPPPLK